MSRFGDYVSFGEEEAAESVFGRPPEPAEALTRENILDAQKLVDAIMDRPVESLEIEVSARDYDDLSREARFGGMRVFQISPGSEWFRRPRSRKRRIRKKWRKRWENWRPRPDPGIIMAGRDVFASPRNVAILRNVGIR